MFRFSLVSSVLLVVSGQAHASWADGLFEELSRDFGSVPRGQTVSHPFRVVNNTGGPVTINSVRVSCGRCSSANALARTLAPGQDTAVLVSMMTNQFSGHKEIIVTVQFSQPRFEEVRLTVRASSRDDIAFSPENLNFGQVKRGKEGTAGMLVTFYGAPTTQITEAKCDSNYVQASVEEVRRDGGEVTYKINGKVRPDTPPGKWFSDIWLKTNNASVAKLRVPVVVEVDAAGALPSTAPSATAPLVNTVTLGKVKAGAQTDRKVVLRGTQPFRILGIQGTDAMVQVQPEVEEAQTVHTLMVRVRALTPGELTRHIRIQTDMRANPQIEFNAQAEIVP